MRLLASAQLVLLGAGGWFSHVCVQVPQLGPRASACYGATLGAGGWILSGVCSGDLLCVGHHCIAFCATRVATLNVWFLGRIQQQVIVPQPNIPLLQKKNAYCVFLEVNLT